VEQGREANWVSRRLAVVAVLAAWGVTRLRALITEHAEKGTLADSLLEELYSFVGEGWKQEDDITLLTLRRSPS